MSTKKIVIVGGVAGGASAAARARRLSEDAEIILFERGPYISFANCGLPYHIGGEIEDREALLVQTPDSFLNRFNVDVRVHSEVVRINRQDKTVTVRNCLDLSESVESYDKLLLSPGAAPVIPPIDGIDNPLIFSLRNIPDMDNILSAIAENKPRHATVIGGGFIGLEMMEAFHHRGIKTSLVELSDQVMAPVDPEMAAFLHQEIEGKGIDLRLGVALEGIQFYPAVGEDKGEGKTGHLSLMLSDGSTIETELLIMAVGVRPETLLAREAGLTLGPLGGIATDAHMQTSDPDIYAVGDATEASCFITGKPTLVPLAGPANRQGRIAADNMLGRHEAYQGTQGTAICKVFDFAVAATGKSEKVLKREKVDYEKVYVHGESHASYYPGAETVSLKLVFDRSTGKVLGAQALGKEGIDKRIDVIAVAIRAGMTVEQLQHLELTYAPPFGSAKDVINQAAFVATNVLKKDLVAIHYDALNSLPDDDYLLLDVRDPGELVEQGVIAGAVNIPLDQLRGRLEELPRDKMIVVYCQIGLRAYVAFRQLVNNGFKAVNLAGGYKTWLMSFNCEKGHDRVYKK